MENSAPSSLSGPFVKFTKTIIPFALVGYEVIITNSRYALVDYFITSYPTRAHGIIVIYLDGRVGCPSAILPLSCSQFPTLDQGSSFLSGGTETAAQGSVAQSVS